MSLVEAWVAKEAKGKFVKEEIDLGPLGAEEVEIAVEHCGVCHSDLSMLNNDWGITSYPAVFGHEVIGTIVELGPSARGLEVGQRVGLGWTAESCMHCRQCMSGDHHLCPTAVGTIVGRKGGFASRVRSHWAWALPIPDGLSAADAGPLMCGGITACNPIMRFATPTSRVGIVGIGGLGHMGLKFAAAYGCDVTAFTSSEAKFDEARGFGANHVVATRDKDAIAKLAGTFDLILVTVNVSLDWDALVATLAPNGRLHLVGAVLDPVAVAIFPMILTQKELSASPTGSPVAIDKLLDFAARHNVLPQTEHMPMSRINEAFERLEAGKAHYRIVLDADF